MQDIAIRIFVYLGLLLLLGASVWLTGLELDNVRIAIHFALAAAQMMLVFFVFMQLRTSPPLIRIMAFGTVLWLLMMFGFTLLDYLHR